MRAVSWGVADMHALTPRVHADRTQTHLLCASFRREGGVGRFFVSHYVTPHTRYTLAHTHCRCGACVVYCTVVGVPQCVI